jgi:hypothetical protein
MIVRIATGSISCLGAMLLLLVVRGPADWSDAFAFLWYGLFGLAVLLALIALGSCFRVRASRDRWIIIALSLPALVAVPAFALIIAALAPLAD